MSSKVKCSMCGKSDDTLSPCALCYATIRTASRWHSVNRLRSQKRMAQLQALADSGCDTWEEYRGEK